MEKQRIAQALRQEARALLKISPWVLALLLLVALLWRIDLAATSGLFQSPPEETPTLESTTEPATPVVTATLALTPTLAPTEAPTATLQPTLTVEPTSTMEPTAPPTEAPPTATLVPSPTSDAGEPEAEQEPQRYADEDANFVFDWSMLVDTVALGASYIWLCCGVLLLVGLPVLFIALWVVSKRRKEQKG
jgi:hypothetical protein